MSALPSSKTDPTESSHQSQVCPADRVSWTKAWSLLACLRAQATFKPRGSLVKLWLAVQWADGQDTSRVMDAKTDCEQEGVSAVCHLVPGNGTLSQ